MNWTVYADELPLLQCLKPKETPSHLYVETQLSREELMEVFQKLPEEGLSIVGTRYPQPRSIELMENSIGPLPKEKIIVSGFARGIDSKAHELALKNKLKTVAILGAGLDQNYPNGNERLRKEILNQGGLLVTEFENQTPPLAYHFLKRNRLIAAFSKATWVVEASERSGSINTANWAMKLEKDLYATPAFPGDPSFMGNQKLLDDHLKDRYPKAIPFWNSKSLALTWSELNSTPELFCLNHPGKSEKNRQLERWVAELKMNGQPSHIQTLLEYVCFHKNVTPGEFYKLYELSLNRGSIFLTSTGQVELTGSI